MILVRKKQFHIHICKNSLTSKVNWFQAHIHHCSDKLSSISCWIYALPSGLALSECIWTSLPPYLGFCCSQAFVTRIGVHSSFSLSFLISISPWTCTYHLFHFIYLFIYLFTSYTIWNVPMGMQNHHYSFRLKSW